MSASVADALAYHKETLGSEEAYDEWEEVDSTGWRSEHKYEHRDVIYRHKTTGRLFEVSESRSGSYWSDYEYDEPTAREVKAVLVAVTEYKPV
ncbi:Uncharacterised protein [Burkholderia pseudomallei]|uniref:hypothetical protein n=1 Tax=Burkholderia pseudomallei TaxID=28450 RepID=UPI00016ABD47|nr:hypothetical protein [Burkholderia pseudomallei]AYX28471.1 hypothetical protein EGY16_10420 [Burkholderia pseudomallei]KGD55274.1 hypothetical protein DP49_953 [Burkholderia pseudomallei]MBF3536147.1 hypothetical protein [Burkholderia pseudomallei]MBF3587791.1 hypothetical protein [Burkholderia pseudomallei]MBF3598354.1 hypothetical protein [Burkholderia pseudomallei]